MNPTFAAAIEALKQADAEVRRVARAMDSATLAASGAEQRLAQLRSNEKDLNDTLSELAQQIAHARELIGSAPGIVEQAKRDGQTEANRLILEATKQAKTIATTHAARADALVAKAHADVADIDKKRREAEEQFKDAQARLDETNARIEQIRQQAAEFAGR